MLTLTIELVPGGFSPLRRTLATMRISNTADLADVSSYLVEALEGANKLTGSPPRSATCEVVGHHRRQSVWALVERAAAEIQKADFAEF
jgi:hypothetical protein